MTRRGLRAAVLAVSLASLLACHTIHFDVSHQAGAPPIEDRKTFLFWTLYPTVEVDMRAICPTGVTAIVEQTRFTDVLLAFVTLGVYTPRTSYYYCRLPPAGATS